MTLSARDVGYTRNLLGKGMKQAVVAVIVGVSQQAVSRQAIKMVREGEFVPVEHSWQWEPYAESARPVEKIQGLMREERVALRGLVGDVDLSTVSLSGCSHNGVNIPTIRNGRVVR